jgi:large subunit ribosomal protein L4
MALVHETVRAELNARRRGTASTRTRGQVRGGSAKPWRQKGTGRARAGSSRSPLWAGGGTVFGPTPRSYVVKVNRKARRGALRSALSEHARRESLAVFDAAKFSEPSTADAFELLQEWGAPSTVLVLLDGSEEAAGKSFRNIAQVEVMPVEDAGVADVIGAASLLVSEAALPALVTRAVGRVRDAGGDGSVEEAVAEAPAPAAAVGAAKSGGRSRAAAGGGRSRPGDSGGDGGRSKASGGGRSAGGGRSRAAAGAGAAAAGAAEAEPEPEAKDAPVPTPAEADSEAPAPTPPEAAAPEGADAEKDES